MVLTAVLLAVFGPTASLEHPPAINYRSIGINTSILYDTGGASVSGGSSVVHFTGARLPTNIGRGDRLILDP
jgi:hypothetical protein